MSAEDNFLIVDENGVSTTLASEISIHDGTEPDLTEDEEHFNVIQELTTQLNDSKHMILMLQNTVRTVNNILQKRDLTIAEAGAEIAELKDKYQAELQVTAYLNTKVEKYIRIKDQLTHELEVFETSSQNNLQAQKEGTQGALKVADLKAKQLTLDKEQLEAELANKVIEISQLKLENKKQTQTLTTLTQKQIASETVIKQLETMAELDHKKLQETVAEFDTFKKHAKDDKDEAIQQVKDEINAHVNRILNESRQSLTNRSQQETSSLKKELHEALQNNQKLQTDITKLTTNNEYLQLQIDDLQSRFDAEKNDNETLKEIIALLKSDSH